MFGGEGRGGWLVTRTSPRTHIWTADKPAFARALPSVSYVTLRTTTPRPHRRCQQQVAQKQRKSSDAAKG